MMDMECVRVIFDKNQLSPSSLFKYFLKLLTHLALISRVTILTQV